MHYFGENMHKTKVFLHKSDFFPVRHGRLGGTGDWDRNCGGCYQKRCALRSYVEGGFFFRKEVFFFSIREEMRRWAGKNVWWYAIDGRLNSW